MKRAVLFIVILLFTGKILDAADSKNEAASSISFAESCVRDLSAEKDLGTFIPFDIYLEAMQNLTYAKIFLNERKYAESYYYGTMAGIRFETARFTAKARMARYQKLKFLSDQCGSGLTSDTIMEANFLKKGDSLRSQLYDEQLFISRKNRIYYKISAEGKERLEKIIRVLQFYPTSRIKIVGHTESFDRRDYSRQKADIIRKFFLKNNIATGRIEIFGLGNNEVVETYTGYRRVSRVEFIISGIK